MARPHIGTIARHQRQMSEYLMLAWSTQPSFLKAAVASDEVEKIALDARRVQPTHGGYARSGCPKLRKVTCSPSGAL